MGLLMWTCGVSNSLDPIKLMGRWSCLIQQLACFLSSSYPLLVMSLINNRTFKCSMGHQISQQDARFHLYTSDGQHYPLNQQVMHHPDST